MDQGLEVVAAVAPLAQPGWIETPLAHPVHLFPIRKHSHPSPPPCSPTSAPSTSPSPLLAPISRPPIDPGAAPCACGCTFIVHAGHRGAKHNHVSETTHFRTILTFVENQGLAREIKVVSGDCESLPLLWTIKVPDSSLLSTHVFFFRILFLTIVYTSVCPHPHSCLPRCRHRTDWLPT